MQAVLRYQSAHQPTMGESEQAEPALLWMCKNTKGKVVWSRLRVGSNDDNAISCGKLQGM
jgi:hypothetical protein